MKVIIPTIILIVLIGCNAPKKVEKNKKEFFWATKFADAAMHRHDSMIYYLRDKPKYEYDYAFLATAFERLGNVDEKYAKYSRDYIDYFVQEDGSINGYKYSDFNIDRVRPGWNILELYRKTGEEKYLKAVKTLVGQMEEQPRTESNGYWHKKIYPWQMWLDGLYMAQPFLTDYAREFDEPKWFDEAAFQIKLIYEKTLDENTGLLYHAWDESKQQQWCDPETGQSKQFWGRGMGWYMMAIVEVLEHMPEDHPARSELIDILLDTSEALLKVQDEATGLWYQVLDMGGEEGNYIEGSASAMFIYSFAKGAKKGFLPEKFLEIADIAFDQLIKVLVVEGDDGFPVLKDVCGGAGLGGDPYRMADYDYYINERIVYNDQKGVAAAIMAAIELGK